MSARRRAPLLSGRALACALAAIAAIEVADAPSRAVAERLFLPMEREGAWNAPDRQLHFGGSLAIAASLRVEGRARSEALALTLGIGAAKEIYDATLKPRRLGRGASRKDLVADLAGAAAGILLLAALDR
jgi:uncharacterized protein YfiM (DUF2279 family)